MQRLTALDICSVLRYCLLELTLAGAFDVSDMSVPPWTDCNGAKCLATGTGDLLQQAAHCAVTVMRRSFARMLPFGLGSTNVHNCQNEILLDQEPALVGRRV